MPYQNDDYTISHEVSYLMNTGHFIPTRPDEVMISELYKDFVEEVLIRFNEYRPNQSGNGRREFIHRSKVEPDYYRLHSSKLSNRVMEMIQEKSSFIRSENN